jgi:chromosome partitioning protein
VRVITVTNNKGGSGKTTTTVSLASAFAERGLRVLVVDLDPQGSATEWLGGVETATGLVEYSTGAVRVSDLIVASTTPGIHLVPASPSLVPSGEDSRNETGLAIIRAFVRLPRYWDIVLVDTPPALGYLSLAPLVASDRIVVPVEPHALSLPGVASVVASIDRARQHVNPHVELLGIVACRVTPSVHAREVIARLRDRFGDVVLQHSIRDSIQIAEAPGLRLPITTYAPTSPVAGDYRAVAAELLDRLGSLESDAGSAS